MAYQTRTIYNLDECMLNLGCTRAQVMANLHRVSPQESVNELYQQSNFISLISLVENLPTLLFPTPVEPITLETEESDGRD
jgi:hypothetical protein